MFKHDIHPSNIAVIFSSSKGVCMKIFFIIVSMLSVIPAYSGELVSNEHKKMPKSITSDNEDILSLISQYSFSKYKFKALIDPNNKIKTINVCDVNPVYIEKSIYIQCSKKGLFITNSSAKDHIKYYSDFEYIYDGLTKHMDYRWSTDEVYCTLSVKEEEDVFELYCVSKDWEINL